MIEIQCEGTKASHIVSFCSDGASKEDHTEIGLDHCVMSQVSHANHQIRHSIERRNHRDLTEMYSRSRSRKTHEDQAGDHRKPKHTVHDLEHGDQVSIDRVRIHVAVANGCKRFHAKEKSMEKRPGRHLGDGVYVQHIQRSKNNIDKQVDAENKTGKPRPSQGQDKMVRISPIELLGVDLNKFELPGPDPDVAVSSPHNESCVNTVFWARIHTR